MASTRLKSRPDRIQIDIVSDVMCPWCIVGYRQLERATAALDITPNVRWHPFELNPQMPPQGQNLGEHIMEKYGSTAQQSAESRERLTKLGHELGFDFRFSEESRIVNTFAAHQLLDWAESKQLQHPLKLALFEAHFTHGKDVSDPDVLADVAASIGLVRAEAVDVLASESHAGITRERQAFWTSRGVSGVPSMIFDGKYLLTGAQGTQTYIQILQDVIAGQTVA